MCLKKGKCIGLITFTNNEDYPIIFHAYKARLKEMYYLYYNIERLLTQNTFWNFFFLLLRIIVEKIYVNICLQKVYFVQIRL